MRAGMTFKENFYSVDRDNAGLRSSFTTRCSCHVVKAPAAKTDGCYLERSKEIKISRKVHGREKYDI